jgi:hypothetical protein
MSKVLRGWSALLTLLAVALFGLPSATAGAAPANKSPITLLTYGDFTGLSPIPDPGLEDMYKAEIAAVNSAGGIHGHPINLIVCDTKDQAAQASACVANAKTEGVVAAVPAEELLDNVTTPLLVKQGIPSLGANPSTAAAQFQKTSACFLNGPFEIYPSLFIYGAKYLHLKSMSINEPPGVTDENILNAATKKAAAGAGVKVPTAIQTALTQSDYSTMVAQAMSQGQDGVMVTGVGPGLASFVRAAVTANPNVKMTGPGFYVFGGSANLLDPLYASAGAKGLLVSSYTALPTDTSIPAVRDFQALMAKAYPADETEADAFFEYVDLIGAIQILKDTPANKPITSTSIIQALQHAKNVNFMGAIPNWSYGYNSQGQGCVTANYTFLSQFNGTTFQALNNDKPVQGIPPAVVSYYKKHLETASR